MAIEFADDVKPPMTKAANPYSDAVKVLAGTPQKDGKPAAKSFSTLHETKDAIVSDLAKIRRQLTEAGTGAGVTVRTKFVTDALSTKVWFWTVPKIVRTAKTPAVATTVTPVKSTAKAKK